MGIFILDTDTLSLLQRRHGIVRANVHRHRQTNVVGITTATIEEQSNGMFKRLRAARTPPQIAIASQFIVETVKTWSLFELYSMPEPATARFESLVKMKLNIGRMDERIAAVALEAGAAVVTRNRQDFGRVPGLTVVDWTV